MRQIIAKSPKFVKQKTPAIHVYDGRKTEQSPRTRNLSPYLTVWATGDMARISLRVASENELNLAISRRVKGRP